VSFVEVRTWGCITAFVQVFELTKERSAPAPLEFTLAQQDLCSRAGEKPTLAHVLLATEQHAPPQQQAHFLATLDRPACDGLIAAH
jgi:hypothetical protein